MIIQLTAWFLLATTGSICILFLIYLMGDPVKLNKKNGCYESSGILYRLKSGLLDACILIVILTVSTLILLSVAWAIIIVSGA